jgi:hypothetical protein
MLPRTKQHRPDSQMQFIEKPGAQVLAYRLNTAAKPNIKSARSSPRLFEGSVNARRDEVELRRPGHPERLSMVMG